MRATKKKPSTRGRIGDIIGDIIQAAMDGNASLVRELLDQGADINTVEPQRGFTCLHIACLNGDERVVSELLDFNDRHGGLDFSIRTSEPPRYAWQLAMSAHHYELAERVDRAGRRDDPLSASGPKPVR